MYSALPVYSQECNNVINFSLHEAMYCQGIVVPIIIDIRDYVNGIGNRSREQYVCIERWPCTPCYSETDDFVELYVL